MQGQVHRKQKAERREVTGINSLGNQLQEALRPLVQAERQAKVELKAQEVKKVEDAKNAGVYSYADEIKKRHPNLSNEVFGKIRTSASVGDAKRLLREHLAAIGH